MQLIHNADDAVGIVVLAIFVFLVVLVPTFLFGCSRTAEIANSVANMTVVQPDNDTADTAEKVVEPKKMFQEVETIPAEMVEADFVDCPSMTLPKMSVAAPVVKESKIRSTGDGKSGSIADKEKRESLYLTRDYMRYIEFGDSYVIAAETQLECISNQTAEFVQADKEEIGTKGMGKGAENRKDFGTFECSNFLIKEHIPGKPASDLKYKNVIKFHVRPYAELAETDPLSGYPARKVRLKIVNAKCAELTKHLNNKG